MTTAANVNDSMVFEELLDSVDPIKRPRGRPRKRPEKLHADKAYDDKKCAQALKRRGIKETHSHQEEGGEFGEAGSAQMGSGADAGVACEGTVGSPSVMSDATTSTRRCFIWAVR